jgi:BMFP domain-containing protein YqiC
VLARTREKLDALEARVVVLEARESTAGRAGG